MNNIVSQIDYTISLIEIHFTTALLLVGILWGVNIVNALIGYRLNILGIYPRHIGGLIGIPCAPFLHAGFNHLFLNSILLVILFDFILLYGEHQFICVTLTIILLSGLLTWLFARQAIHIGASSLVMGYWGYLLISAYQHPTVLTILLAIICVYYFGSLVYGLFPGEKKMSWEGHIFGFVAGIAAVYVCT